jgi:hypothetical protein
MNRYRFPNKEIVRAGGAVCLRLLAVVTGFVLMVAGLDLGIGLMLFPVNFLLAFAGLLLFLSGLLGWSAGENAPT